MEHDVQMDAVSDGALLARFVAERSQTAFQAVVERHAGLVLAACRRRLGPDAALAEDATQAVFLVLAAKAKGLTGSASVAGFLVRTAGYASANLQRQERRRRRREQEVQMDATCRDDDPDQGDDRAHLRRRLDAALDRLPEKAREAVILHHLEGRPQAEVARLLGCSEDAAKKRIHYAIERLRHLLGLRGAAVSATALAGLLAVEAGVAAEGLAQRCAAQASALIPGAALPEPARSVLRDWARHSLQPAVMAAGGAIAALGLVIALHRPAEVTTTTPPKPVAVGTAPTIGHGRLGPFLWTRAIDQGEDARLETVGRALRLTTHGYARRDAPTGPVVKPRNNLICEDAGLGFVVQPESVRILTPGAHNLKVLIGYAADGPAFRHGDDADLLDRAPFRRVCLLLPMRHAVGADPNDPSSHQIPWILAAQPPCIIELAAGEHLPIDWQPDPEDPRVLCDLSPVFRGLDLRPAITRPLVRFDVTADGGWRLRLEVDGRDGLAGGGREGDYDVVLTQDDAGGRRHHLGAPGRWAMSVVSPGGGPFDSVEFSALLAAYGREDGQGRLPPKAPTRLRTVTPRDPRPDPFRRGDGAPETLLPVEPPPAATGTN